MMNVDRNDPCPCGSGKKYKKCCLHSNISPPEDLHYRRLSEVHDRLMEKLVPYARKIFGEAVFDAALSEFLLWPEPDQIPDKEALDRAMHLFWPWLVFNWECDPYDTDFECLGPPDKTVGEIYVQDPGARLDPLEDIFIKAVNRTPYSFYEVLDVEPGRGIHLKDVLRAEEITVQERSGSQYVHKNDLIFGRAAIVDGIGMILGLSPFIIPPGRKTDLIKLRQQMQKGSNPITSDNLYEWDAEIREVYFGLDYLLHSPPQMSNADGDPLEFHKLLFEIDSANSAFEKLAPLAVTESAKALRKQAETDSSGNIKKIEIPWTRKGHKSSRGFSNTLLGNLVIEGGRLTVEVNSGRRAATICKEIEKRLGSEVRFKVDEIRTLDSMMKEARSKKKKTTAQEQEDLKKHPEVRRKMTEMILKHWESWVDLKLPALNNQTPRKAIKTPDGREAIEALLSEAERGRGIDKDLDALNREGVRKVRKILGL